MTNDKRLNGKEAGVIKNSRRDELLPDLAETLAELFRAVEDRHPRNASELGRWVEGLGVAIATSLTPGDGDSQKDT